MRSVCTGQFWGDCHQFYFYETPNQSNVAKKQCERQVQCLTDVVEQFIVLEKKDNKNIVNNHSMLQRKRHRINYWSSKIESISAALFIHLPRKETTKYLWILHLSTTNTWQETQKAEWVWLLWIMALCAWDNAPAFMSITSTWKRRL